MAKRRKLTTPSTEDLSRIEAEFRSESSVPGLGAVRAVAPISQVAADAASASKTSSPEVRARQAKLEADAERLVVAEEEGRLLLDIPLSEIDADAMIRDRSILDEEEMNELRKSIASNGVRLPVEVYALAEPHTNETRYGLISGYRRLMAVRGLAAMMGPNTYDTIKAIVRPTTERDAAIMAMVEENEIRAELSQFERGRIAVISTQQGVFVNIEDAVNHLFGSASKAKRSKVRSFAMIFEELGDMLSFPEALSEKKGLQVAQALRNGLEGKLRNALADEVAQNPVEEWAVIEAVLARNTDVESDPKRGGRPKTRKQLSGWSDAKTLVTSSGVTIRQGRDEKGFLLRFEGSRVDAEIMETLMIEIKALLE
ncbi:MAG: ParB N-terminal domain-containing protein [Pseudoruegeria sp.]